MSELRLPPVFGYMAAQPPYRAGSRGLLLFQATRLPVRPKVYHRRRNPPIYWEFPKPTRHI